MRVMTHFALATVKFSIFKVIVPRISGKFDVGINQIIG